MDKIILNHLLDIAWQEQCLALPNPSVASMILKDNEIIGVGIHNRFGAPHAEILALQNAYFYLTKDANILSLKNATDIHDFLNSKHNGIFKNCEIYVTLEPCNHFGKTPPCSMLLSNLGFAKIIYGSTDDFGASKGGATNISKHTNTTIKGGVLQSKCDDLLIPFLCLQNKKRFVLFKLAMRLNGDYKAGKISSAKCLEFSHRQRAASEYILISENTLKEDNPLLDTRYFSDNTDAKLPKIIILARDKNIDLKEFNIYKNKREILVIENINEIEKLNGFIIIEGGFNLLNIAKNYIDLGLFHISSKLSNQNFSSHITKDLQAKILHISQFENEASLWLKF